MSADIDKALGRAHLGHFEAGDLVKLALGLGDVTEVGAKDAALRLGDTVVPETLVTECSLVTREGDLTGLVELIMMDSTHHP